AQPKAAAARASARRLALRQSRPAHPLAEEGGGARMNATASFAVALSILAQTITIPPATPVAKAIEPLVEVSRLEEMRWPDFTDYRKHIRNFYAPRGYEPVWVANGKPTPQALGVIALLDAADAKGINAVDYDATRWPERIAALPR